MYQSQVSNPFPKLWSLSLSRGTPVWSHVPPGGGGWVVPQALALVACPFQGVLQSGHMFHWGRGVPQALVVCPFQLVGTPVSGPMPLPGGTPGNAS